MNQESATVLLSRYLFDKVKNSYYRSKSPGTIRFHLYETLSLYRQRKETVPPLKQGQTRLVRDFYEAPKDNKEAKLHITPDETMSILKNMAKRLPGLELVHVPTKEEVLEYEELFNQLKDVKRTAKTVKKELRLEEVFNKLYCLLNVGDSVYVFWDMQLPREPETAQDKRARAEQNNASPVSPEEIKYQLTYNPTKRELRLNDILIAKPQYGSENDQFLRFFVAENNTGEQTVDKLLAFMGKDKLTKRPTQILGDVRITGDIKTVFFPNASKRAIEFSNPITIKYAEELGLPEIDLASLAKTVRSSQK